MTMHRMRKSKGEMNAHLAGLSPEYVRNALIYVPETGEFYWKTREDMSNNWNSKYAGKPAGSLSTSLGYCIMRINSICIYGHRVAWCHFFGKWPESIIDHINGVKNDNRIVNLRLSNHKNNMLNRDVRKDSALRVRGVYLHQYNKKYVAYICPKGKKVHLGCFETLEEAKAVYDQEARRLYGEFVRL